MSKQDYENFLKNTLNINDRYPTIEEVLLSLDLVLPHNDKERGYGAENKNSFDNVKARIFNSKIGRQNINKTDITLYLNYFGIKTKTFLDDFSKIISEPLCYWKDSYILGILNLYFREIMNVPDNWDNCYGMKQKPLNTEPFTTLVKELDLKFSDKNLSDNYRNWCNGTTPTIDNLMTFFEALDSYPEQKKKFWRETVLKKWFCQKCQGFSIKYDSDESGDVRARTNEDINKKFAQMHTHDDPGTLDENTSWIEQAKEQFYPFAYSGILCLDIMHLILQRKFKDASELVKKFIPLIFYCADSASHFWYGTILSLLAAQCLDKNVDKKDKISLKGYFKKVYSIGCILGYENDAFNLDDKDKEKVIHEKYARRFNDWCSELHFYDKGLSAKRCFPKPNYKKANQQKIDFGTAVRCPQIVFYSQLNEYEIVQKLLDSGAQITNTPSTNESALYWSLVTLGVNTHLSFGRTTIMTPNSNITRDFGDYAYKAKEIPCSDFLQHLKAGVSVEDSLESSYKLFKEIKDQERTTAHKIYNALLPHYKDSKNTYPGVIFQKQTASFESILNRAVCTGDVDILSDVIDLYKAYRKDPQADWIDEIAERPQPRTALFWIIRLYRYIDEYDVHFDRLVNEPFSNFFDMSDIEHYMAEYRTISSPNDPTMYTEHLLNVNHELNHVGNIFYQNHLQVCEHRYMGEILTESVLRSMLKLLLHNHANPLTLIDGEPINRRKEYNSMLEAIEVGWLDGIKMMVEAILQDDSFKVNFNIKDLKEYALNCAVISEESKMVNWEKRAQRCRAVAQYFESLTK